MDIDLFGVLARMREKCTVFFLLSDNIRPNGHRSILGSRKDARKMQGVFFVVGWHPT